MAEPLMKKNKFSDDEIDSFILKIQTQQVKSNQKIFSNDDILSISYVMSEFVDAVQKIKDYPSAFQVELFREVCHDKKLHSALRDPYVALALELKKAYDMGNLPWFDKVLEFEKRNKLELEDDPVMASYWEISQSFLPGLLEIYDIELKEAVETNDLNSSLIQLGRTRYEDIVNELLCMRFSDRDSMTDMTIHLHNSKLAAHWANSYDLVQDSKLHASEVFYGYIGALSLTCIVPLQREAMITWISILIEPILMNYESALMVSSDAKTKLIEELPGVEFRLVHIASDTPDPVFIIQAWCGYGALMVGISSASTVIDAENRAAGVALYKKSNIERAHRVIEDFGEFYYTRYLTLSRPSVSTFSRDSQTFGNTSPGVTALQTPYEQQQKMNVSVIRQQQPIQMLHGAQQQLSVSFMNSTLNALATQPPPEMFNNNDYQRQIEDLKDIALADPMADEIIDKSSKEKFNHVLLDRRYTPAEYKTSKLTNTDVQVMCYVDNIPLARAISTNKKKAGQICAQFILNYLDYFMQKLPPR
jgi:dsRNA-specific ribonuclease